MGKMITELMIKTTYDYARKIYHNQIELKKGLDEIESLTGMDRGSANAYVHVFSYMLKGKEYHRTMNTAATKYFLQRIHDDYGVDHLQLALKAVKEHSEYYARQGRGSLRSIERLVEELALLGK